MDARASFKQGFLAHCIESGITDPTQIRDMLKTAVEKRAVAGGLGLGLIGSKLLEGVGDVAGTASLYGGAALAAGPAILGGAAGYLAGHATDADDSDVDEMKRREVVDEYRTQSARLRREGDIRRQLAASPRGGRRAFF